MSAEPTNETPELYRSLAELADADRFRELTRREFADDARDLTDPVERRRFLQLSAAGVALATGAGCNASLKPASQRKVLPYVQQPDTLLPGIPMFFATAMAQAGGVGLGLVVKSTEGRPIKAEGNPSHPSSLGGTNLFAQAAVLDVYDPDRSKEVLHRGLGTSYERVLGDVRAELDRQKGKRGAGVRILTGPTTSPTLIRLIREFLSDGRFPDARWVPYAPLADANARKGAFDAFGKHVRPVYKLDQAKVVLSLDCDFLDATGPGGPRYARDFISRRKVREVKKTLERGEGVKAEDMARLYAVESMVTCTGGTADHRLPLKPSQVEAFARAVAVKLGVAGVAAGAELPAVAATYVEHLAADLKANNGKAVVLVGDGQPAAVHQIGWAINHAIGAVGPVVSFTEPFDGQPADKPADPFGEYKQLAADLRDGKVDLLLAFGVNPVYDFPAEPLADVVDPTAKRPVAFADLYRKAKVSVHLGHLVDETAHVSTYHVNAAHFLESWGDVRGHDGTASVQQPLIAPLFNGKTAVEFFGGLLDQTGGSGLELVRATWQQWFADNKKDDGKPDAFERFWQQGVQLGVLAGTAAAAVTVPTAATAGLDASPAKPADGLEIQFRPDPSLYDGRYANNGWLQELPKQVTNLAWDNAALVSPATAAKLGCDIAFAWTAGERGRAEADVVELTVAGRKLKAAVWVLPGHADDAVTLHVGHGRWRAGTTGTGTGFNAYLLRGFDSLWHAPVDVRKTGETFYLACTQGQYAMEGRRPHRSATVAQYRADEEFAQIPAATPGEYKEIRELTPGTPEEWARLHAAFPSDPEHPYADHGHGHHGHDHDHSHKADGEEGHSHPEGHDKRVIPLSLYPEYPNQVANQPGDRPRPANEVYRRWGLSIDLNSCTGCTACVVACQAENNIPVVGKVQVSKGRAMHWLRIDRYFSIPGPTALSDELGDRYVRGPERAERVKDSAAVHTHFQPMMCVHCEKAPCEVVCPVNATVHSADGLNDMVYNRCVGTRYCSNNCPYKVRRFNFIQYADYTTESLKLVNNPEVTVRQRGVMEKCTYCVQRIRNAEMEAEREFATRLAADRPEGLKDWREGRPKIADGEVLTACQQACPTAAIVFGDINDLGSQVLRLKAEPLAYGVLAELNVMPRTTWIAAIRNPNPDLDKALAGAKGA